MRTKPEALEIILDYKQNKFSLNHLVVYTKYLSNNNCNIFDMHKVFF